MPRNLVPPIAPRSPVVNEVHGERRVDDYHWLRNKGSKAVTAYLNAENAYTDAMMKPARALQATLYREMVARIKETDVEVPYRDGDYFYYTTLEERENLFSLSDLFITRVNVLFRYRLPD